MTKPATVGLTAFDFMELVAFDRKVDSEGFRYAAENYPPAFERDGYRRCDDLTRLHALLHEYADRINEFWDRDDAVDLHNAHIDESDRANSQL